eukprot:8971295-Pyramimonas_sp.AAC.1
MGPRLLPTCQTLPSGASEPEPTWPEMRGKEANTGHNHSTPPPAQRFARDPAGCWQTPNLDQDEGQTL